MSTETATPSASAAPQGDAGATPGVAPGTEPATAQAQAGAATDPSAAGATAEPTAAAEPAKDPAEDPRLSKAFGALARKDRELRERERATKANEAELTAWRNFQAQLKSNPAVLLELAEAQGIKLETLIDTAAAAGREPTVEDKLKELEEWKAEQERRAQEAEATAAKAQEQAQIAQVIDQIKALAASPDHADRYELVNAEGAHEEAWNVILAYHQRHNEVLPFEVALDAVEKELEEREATRVESLLKTKKFSKRFAPAPAAPAASAQPPASNAPAGGKASASPTLTNSTVSEVPANAQASWPTDIEESRKRAAQLIRFT